MENQITKQTQQGRPRYAYVSAPVKWARRLQFLFFWTMAHALAGAIGIILAETIIRSAFLRSLSIAAGIFVFEAVILFGKHLVFLRFKELKGIRLIDTLTWCMAGCAVIIGEFVEKSAYSEGITSISLNVLRLSTFLSLGLFASLPIITFLRDLYLKYVKVWRLKIEEFISERLLFSLLQVPIYIVFFVFLIICAFVLLCAVIFSAFILILLPIEYFKTTVEYVQWTTDRSALFGASSVGYAGFLTGLFYTLRMRAFYVWKKSTDIKRSSNGIK